METTVHSTSETQKLAQQLAVKLQPSQVLALYGDLGAGKTTFTRFLVEHLGGITRVQSPTFVIARKYKVQKSIIPGLERINHLDLYRLKAQSEIHDLDLEHFFNDTAAITIVEWPEIAEHLLPKNSIKIRFEYIDEDSRKIYVENTN
jgi:tRNA threonylcarbamoyladenosine biosynthesis protein TsaE